MTLLFDSDMWCNKLKGNEDEQEDFQALNVQRKSSRSSRRLAQPFPTTDEPVTFCLHIVYLHWAGVRKVFFFFLEFT